MFSLLYGVISVSVNFLVRTFSLFVKIQFSNSCKYDCCCLAAVLYLESCARIVRSVAYESTSIVVQLGCMQAYKVR